MQWPPIYPTTPIRTPDVPPLWADPAPPIINNRRHPDLPQPPGVSWSTTPQREPSPTGRHPLTNAPVWQRGQPEIPWSQLPPGQPQPAVTPNARSPVTGALMFFRGPVPPGWEL